MKSAKMCKVFLLSAAVLLAGLYPARSSPAENRVVEEKEEKEKTESEKPGDRGVPDEAAVRKWMNEPAEPQKKGRKKKAERYADRYVPLATGRMPFYHALAVNRVGVNLNWLTKSSGSLSASAVALGLEGEYAPVPKVFSLGLRMSMDIHYVSFGSQSDSDAALRSFEFGVKGTAYDNGRGSAVAVAGKFGIGNAESSGFNADFGALGGGVMGSFAQGLFRLVGAFAGSYQFPIDDRLRGVGLVQWAIQPSVAAAGPHNLAVCVNGSLVFGETSSGESDYVHMVDIMFGYVKGGDGVQASVMVGMPLNHRTRADFGIFAGIGSTF